MKRLVLKLFALAMMITAALVAQADSRKDNKCEIDCNTYCSKVSDCPRGFCSQGQCICIYCRP